MNTDILSKDKDPMGAAILDYQTKGKAGKLSILSSMFEEDEMPVKHLFRNLEEMPILEQKALSLAKGKVLDVGAGAGCHALALQAQSIAVKAINISPQSCQAILNETGFATPNKENFALHFFIKDHLGNVRILADSKGNVEQAIDYYPFGSIIAESKDTERQPYLYNGKELDRMNGLDWYDYGARMYESDGLRWGQIDPRAENTPEVSPYVYCNNNPIRRLDYRGMFYGDYYDNNGQLLGNDGRNDQKVYVIRAKSSTSFETYGNVNVNGIKNKQRKAAIQELQKFNGDYSHDFTNVQNSFVELDGSKEIRKEVVSKISDDGNGGTSDNNNREYGMNFAVEDPFKVYSYQGDIAKSEENTVSVEMPKSENLIDIHTHPSGTIIPNLRPAPSEQDIRNGNEHSNSYVISMSNKTVYIYNKHGILTYFPLKIYTK